MAEGRRACSTKGVRCMKGRRSSAAPISACDRPPRMASCSSAGRSFSGKGSSFSSSVSRAACAGWSPG